MYYHNLTDNWDFFQAERIHRSQVEGILLSNSNNKFCELSLASSEIIRAIQRQIFCSSMLDKHISYFFGYKTVFVLKVAILPAAVSIKLMYPAANPSLL